MNRIIPVVIAVIHHEGKFLLTLRKNDDEEDKEFGGTPLWHFPGGALEFGERIDTALIREIKEETTLTIKIEGQTTRIFSAVRKYWHGLLIPHLCSVVGKTDITLDHESLDYGWFTGDEIKKLPKLPFVQEMADAAAALLKKG